MTTYRTRTITVELVVMYPNDCIATGYTESRDEVALENHYDIIAQLNPGEVLYLWDGIDNDGEEDTELNYYRGQLREETK